MPLALRTVVFLLVACLSSPGLAWGVPCVMRADLDGVVNHGTTEHLRAATRAAVDANCQALLVVIDTPGGFLEATRDIAQGFLDAPLPVVAYVGPPGARAGSAGAFLMLAAHVAAMAPGTNVGAAHPVDASGGEQSPTMAKKVENDAAAFARALAQQRGRNVEWAEAAVRESASATAQEAFEKKVVDHVVATIPELLRAIDETEVTVGSRQVTLRTADAEVRTFERTLRQKALGALGDPNLVYLLMMLGMLALMTELYNPGMIAPGVLGVLLLLLAGIGMNMLPVDVGAIALLVVAAGLFVAELFITSHGILAIGGVVMLLIGSSLLIDDAHPDFFADASVRVSWGLVIPTVAVTGGGAVALAWVAARFRRRGPITGAAGLVGAEAQVASAIGAEGGWVRVAGERWHAVSAVVVPEGARVRVLSVRGLDLEVEPVSSQEAS